MTPVDQAEWVEIPADFEIELDGPATAAGGETVAAGVHHVNGVRHTLVTDEAGRRGGATTFRIELAGRPAWLAATSCAPYAVESWD
jgi:hypothetical protein